MLCEKCANPITEPLPPDLDRFSGHSDNLIRALWMRRGATIAAPRLIWAMYGGSDEPSDADNVLRVTIHYMRKKLRNTPYRIETVTGRGYRLVQVVDQKITV